MPGATLSADLRAGAAWSDGRRVALVLLGLAVA